MNAALFPQGDGRIRLPWNGFQPSRIVHQYREQIHFMGDPVVLRL
jgi:hypothetical protein